MEKDLAASEQTPKRSARESGAPEIVFSDMDGTFLTSDKRVTDVNWRALDALAERGIPFVICTARAENALPGDIAAHPATRYAVCANGAYTIDLARGERVGAVGIPSECVLALYEICESLDAICDLFADGVAYTRRDLFARLEEFVPDPVQRKIVTDTRIVTDLRVPELVGSATWLDRVTVFWRTEEARDAVVAYAEEHPEITWTSSYDTAIEITSSAATKGSALSRLCGRLGIGVAGAFAFGDHLNDVSMIEEAGTGVAMANAIPEAKAAANALAASCDESGEGRFILESLDLEA